MVWDKAAVCVLTEPHVEIRDWDSWHRWAKLIRIDNLHHGSGHYLFLWVIRDSSKHNGKILFTLCACGNKWWWAPDYIFILLDHGCLSCRLYTWMPLGVEGCVPTVCLTFTFVGFEPHGDDCYPESKRVTAHTINWFEVENPRPLHSRN